MLAIGLALGGFPTEVSAQVPGWTATLVVQPFPSPFIADWQRNPQMALLNLIYSGQAPQDFRVEGFVRSAARGELARVVSPPIAFGFGPVTQLFTSADILDWETVRRDRLYTDQVLRTGMIPEGRHQMCARVLDAQSAELASTCADFTIALPEPPRLIFPANRGVVAGLLPVFQWTPIFLPPEIGAMYRVRVFELLRGQTPETATLANPVWFEAEATAPLVVYPLDALPLDPMKQYVWSVEALDGEGRPVTRGGRSSEIWTFAVGGPGRELGETRELPDTLTLIPGVARLTGLRSAQVGKDDFAYVVNGWVNLELEGAAPARLRVEALDLAFDQRSVVTLPLVRSGALRGSIRAGSGLDAAAGSFVRLTDITYDRGAGLTVGAELALPGVRPLRMEGRAQVTAVGLYGVLESRVAAGATVTKLGRTPLEYVVTGGRLSLPLGRLELDGRVRLLGADLDCPAVGTVANDVATVPVLCQPKEGFTPGGTGTRPLVAFGVIAGTLMADFLGDRLDGELRAASTLRVFGDASEGCTVSFTLVAARESLTREDERGDCDAGRARASFGWVTMGLSQLRLERFELDPSGRFIWRALVNLSPEARGAENLQLPYIEDVVLDENGVRLPSSSSDAPGTGTTGVIEIDSVRLLPRTMGFVGGLVPYDRWLGGQDPGFEWGSATSWISFPHVTFEQSGCLNAQPFEVDTLVIRGGRIEAVVDRRFETGCVLRVTGSIHVNLASVSGPVRFTLGEQPRVIELPLVAGEFVHPVSDCGQMVIGCLGQTTTHPLTGELRLTATGRLVGTAEGYQPPWVTYDLFFAKLSPLGGRLELAVSDSGTQTAIYDGSISVTFGRIEQPAARDTSTEKTEEGTGAAKEGLESKAKDVAAAAKEAAGPAGGLVAGVVGSADAKDKVTATARIDVRTNRLLSGDIALEGPFEFRWGFVQFVIDRATLGPGGLLVDGRQRFLVDSVAAKSDGTFATTKDSTLATFARVSLDPATFTVSSGTVALASGLALEWQPTPIALRAVSELLDASFTWTPALHYASGAFNPRKPDLINDPIGGNIRLVLPGTPAISADGFRVDGRAPAQIAFRGSQYDSASVTFEGGFALDPWTLRVTTGRAQVRVRDYPIAHLDAGGWHFSIAELLTTVIPDTLPLFDKATAFVPLKDADGNLLVQVDSVADGTRIRTRTGETLRLVVPALKGTRPAPPSLAVTFDLILERGTFRPLAGALSAKTASGTADGGPTADFPFVLDSIDLRVPESRPASLFAHGRLALLGAGQRPLAITLALEGGGALAAGLEQAFTDTVAVGPGAAPLRFAIDTLRFSASGRLNDVFVWRLELPGGITYVDVIRGRHTRLATATFRLSARDAALVNFTAPDSLFRLSVPGVDLLLGRFRAPTFRWEFAQNRFDFEFLFDAGLEIPALDSLRLPEIRDVRVTPQGLVVPAFEVAAVPTVPDPYSPFDSGADTLTGIRVGGFAVRALAYRFREFRWDWSGGTPPPAPDFGVDLEFAIEDIPSGLEGQAARIALRALDVGWRDGRLSGAFERVDFPRPLRTVVADIRGAFGTFSASLDRLAEVRVGLLADLRLPDRLTCPGVESSLIPLTSPNDTLFLAGNGTVYGVVRDALPTCVLALGPLTARVGNSTARLGFDAPTGRVTSELDATVVVELPGEQDGETVSATGQLRIDLVRGDVLAAEARIAEPFYWAPMPGNPFLRLVVSEAVLTRSWLQFGAGGQLRTAQGGGVDVAFDAVAFDLNTGRLASGRIRITGDAAVGLELSQAGTVQYGVYPASEPRGDGVSARVVLPVGAMIDTAGVRLTGSATASLGYGGETYAALAAVFDSAFTIGFNPRVALTQGRLDLRTSQGDLIAYLDQTGFWPGNVFAALPIPARLGLPSADVAYLQLRSSTDSLLLVETIVNGDSVRLRTRPGQPVDLVVPALADGGRAPVIRTQLDLVVHARNLQPLSGEIVITTGRDAPLITLPGYPVSITRLAYRGEAGGYRLRLGARALLPGPLDDLNLEFRDLELTAEGLRGQVELGRYSEVFTASAAPIAEARLRGDTLAVRLTGARLTLAPANNVLEISGAIHSVFFAPPNGAPRGIQWAGRIDAQGFRATADVNDRETPLTIGVAALTLENGPGQPAIVVEASDEAFALRMGGTLSLPELAPGFSLGIRDLRVGSAGVSLPDISLTNPTSTAEFSLFGLAFALRDSVVDGVQVTPAVDVAVSGGVLHLTMSGYVTVFRNTTRFVGLHLATNGDLNLQAVDFLSRPLDLIPGYVRLARARVANRTLELVGDVTLPAPFTTGAPQEVTVRILPDGRVTGGGRVILLNEAEGLATAQAVVRAGVAAFHVRYLDLVMDFTNETNTAVSAVADIYVQDDPRNLLRFGSVAGGTVAPGIRVAIGRRPDWGGLEMPNPITVRMAPATLTFRQATVQVSDTGFAVAIGGELALAVAGGSGSLAFRNVGFTSRGEIQLGEATFDGGTFTIQEKVKLVVGRVAWNSAESSIYVPVARPPEPDGRVRPDSALVTVRNFLDFGASVDVAGVFSGGVDRVLVYVRADDGTTHLLIQNLAAQIPDVIAFRGSLRYDELPDGFDLAISTEGTLLTRYEVAMVGVMRRRANQFSAGIFLRTSVEVPLVPGVVTLTGVGGGLFINPSPNDLLLVKGVAGLSGPAADRLGMPPASQFAVMLYASMDIVGAGGASAASGRAMLTVTDRAAQLNATATFFRRNQQMSGDLALQVGWSPAAYVRGDIAMVVDFDNTVEGIGSVQFFAGSNTFAVKGNVDLTVVKVLTAYAEVIIVPSGFTANLGYSFSKAAPGVSLSMGANLRIWYRPSTQDLGAYARFTGQATALGFTGELGMVGALVIQPELAIYAQGYARVVGVELLTFEVWAQYTSRGLAAGLGRNDELAAVLARAEQVAAELEAEADAILAGIDAAAQEIARTPIAVPRESLAAAYASFQRWNWVQMLVLWSGFRSAEGTTRGGLLPTTATDPYVTFYERVLSNTEAAADTALVVQLRAEAAQKLAVIADRRAGVEARIRALQLELLELEETAAFVAPADPVTTWSSGNPTLVEGPAGPDGAPTMVLTGVPVFELDNQLAATARGTMAAAQAATLARQERLRGQIAAVEAGLTTVLAATSAGDANSFASYARLHSDAVEAIERQHAVNVEFRMRRRAWAQTKLDTLARERSALEQRIGGKLDEIRAYQQTQSKPGWARRLGTAVELDTLASRRVRYLSAWSQSPALLDTYHAEAASWRTEATAAARALQADSLNGAASARLDLALTWFNTQAAGYGMRNWWEVADAGLTQARDGAQTVVDEAVSAADLAVRPVRDQLAALTSRLASLNARQAQVYGILYDLYDDYLRTYGSSGTEGQQFTSRRASLAEMLQAPRVASPRVVVTDYGFLSSIATTWSGTHPRGVYEYLLQEGADSLHSVGGVGESRRWVYSALPAGGSFARNQQVHVRGGAGLTGNALSSYTLTFASTPLATPRSTVAAPPADVTPPSRPVVEFVGLTTLVNASGVTETWTADSTRVTARWSALDPESGIAEFEYRVLAYPPAQTTTRTSTTFGEYTLSRPVAPVVLVDWTSAGGRTSVAILGLRLRSDQTNYVEVRARNGAGLVGDPGASPILRLDPTPPMFPAGTVLTPPAATFTTLRSLDLLATAPPLAPACGTTTSIGRGGSVERPIWDGRLVTVTSDNGVVGGGAPVRLTLSRPDATDPETGIYGYNYRVDSVAPGAVLPADGWADIVEATPTFIATGPTFLFGRPHWVSLVAMNALGVRSTPVTYGPVTVPDPTVPSSPVFCGAYSGGIIAYLTTPAVDDETGVRGYQIRVRDAATGATVRPFPSGVTVDWPAAQTVANTGVRIPFTPTGGWRYIVDLRAVSGLGVAGDIASSGEVLADATPPPVAGVTGRVVRGAAELTLTVQTDPESGLGGVDIAFGTAASEPSSKTPSGTYYTPYATYAVSAGTSVRTITLPEQALMFPEIYAFVRVRNGAGIVSTAAIARIK